MKTDNAEDVSLGSPIISVRGLSKIYRGKVVTRALDDISFDVRRHETFTLLGRNGAGKTTTVKILATLMKRDSGDVSIFGSDPQQSSSAIREKIAIVPQEGKPIDYLSPKENIVLYLRMRGVQRSEAQTRAENIIDDFGMSEFAHKKSSILSTGQRQITLVAMAISSNPELIFLDEPTLGLDPVTRQRVWQKINELKKVCTIFLTTHYMDEAEKLSDTVALIKKGVIVKKGAPQELINDLGYDHKIIVKGLVNNTTFSEFKSQLVVNDTLMIFIEKNRIEEAAGKAVRAGLEFSTARVSLEDVFIITLEDDEEK
jgi:ABC-2 type transport system ATP-binding protein